MNGESMKNKVLETEDKKMKGELLTTNGRRSHLWGSLIHQLPCLPLLQLQWQ